ncbi:hypothetical protein GQ53DRAFT_679481, partial [Thozetella sp. PMI_491]
MSDLFMILGNIPVIIMAYFLYTGGFLDTSIDRVQEYRSAGDVWSSIAPYTCDNGLHRMQPTFLSYDPIIMYIEGFLTTYEARHLRKLAEPRYNSSVVEGQPRNDSDGQDDENNIQNGETAWLASPDPVVDCVRARAAAFQGYNSNETIASLAAVRYTTGGELTAHYDWDTEAPREVDRKTSFFAVLEASRRLQGGATSFPLVEKPVWSSAAPDTWCRFLDCEAEGLAVKPIQGDALFWVNFREDGRGHNATAHAGQPVLRGKKVGLNIWT